MERERDTNSVTIRSQDEFRRSAERLLKPLFVNPMQGIALA